LSASGLAGKARNYIPEPDVTPRGKPMFKAGNIPANSFPELSLKLLYRKLF
jgi:hypothetical protein